MRDHYFLSVLGIGTNGRTPGVAFFFVAVASDDVLGLLTVETDGTFITLFCERIALLVI